MDVGVNILEEAWTEQSTGPCLGCSYEDELLPNDLCGRCSRRQELIGKIRESVRGQSAYDLEVLICYVAADVVEGARFFCLYKDLKDPLAEQIIKHDISVAHELYQLLNEVNQAEMKITEVEASGEHNNETTSEQAPAAQ